MSVKVSVVIPVYNIEQHLRQCLDSVAGQTLKDIEIICVDDGSTDGSGAILEEYAQKDSRFHLIRQENIGPGIARNRGMKQATGKYLIFLDSDDWFEPDFLQCMVQDAERTKADVTICRSDEFDTSTGKKYGGQWMLKMQYLPDKVFAPADVAQYVFQFTYGWPWDKLYRREYIQKLGIQYPDLAVSQDLVFVFPSIFCAECVATLDKVLIHHRINRLASVSNSRAKHPTDSYQAVMMVRNYLQEHKIWKQYEQSFLNWAIEFLIWHVSRIGDRAVQQCYYNRLRSDWMKNLQFDTYPREFFINEKTFAKYRLVKIAPYPLFVLILRLYKAWKQ